MLGGKNNIDGMFLPRINDRHIESNPQTSSKKSKQVNDIKLVNWRFSQDMKLRGLLIAAGVYPHQTKQNGVKTQVKIIHTSCSDCCTGSYSHLVSSMKT